jgi:hypothetical protein
MHQLFAVGAKLLGIYFITDGLIEACVLTHLSTSPFAPQIAISCLVKLTAGTALAFFTGVVAKGLRVEEPADQTPSLSYRSALEVGILLLGLLQLLLLLPQAIRHVTDYSQQFTRTRNPFDLLSVETVGLAVPLVMLLFAHRIAAFLERVNRHSSAS